jgi:hypothetical protein
MFSQSPNPLARFFEKSPKQELFYGFFGDAFVLVIGPAAWQLLPLQPLNIPRNTDASS